jgi:membrane-associated phospholipid phosphatase
MSASSRLIDLILSAVLILGAYQIYFWCQRQSFVPPREWSTRLDAWIPFAPAWVWVYSFLYYPAILYVNLVVKSADQFIRIAFSYLLLLALQAAIFVVFPVRTPAAWRNARGGGESLSERFLALVQRFDAPTNSFPSMHTSVAMLTALHLVPQLGSGAYLFPVLIAASCVLTKQHYLIDLPPGAALGWVAYEAYGRVVTG